MYLYEHKQLYNQYTGKPEQVTYHITDKIICDYLGVEVSEKEIEYTPFDISGCEEWYYYEDFLIGDRKVDMYEFMHKQQGFHYINEDKYILLLLEYMNVRDTTLIHKKHIKEIQESIKKEGYGELITNAASLADTMLKARIRVIQKLVKEGADPLTFGIVFEED